MPKVTILPDGKTVDVPQGTTLLEASEQAGALHGSACGGVGACSSCHVHVTQGFDALSEADDNELDRLDQAFDVKPNSRLGCQAQVGAQDVTFEVTPESLRTWLDEHPQARHAVEAGQMPEGATPALVARLEPFVRR